jgi:hypothetical protein
MTDLKLTYPWQMPSYEFFTMGNGSISNKANQQTASAGFHRDNSHSLFGAGARIRNNKKVSKIQAGFKAQLRENQTNRKLDFLRTELNMQQEFARQDVDAMINDSEDENNSYYCSSSEFTGHDAAIWIAKYDVNVNIILTEINKINHDNLVNHLGSVNKQLLLHTRKQTSMRNSKVSVTHETDQDILNRLSHDKKFVFEIALNYYKVATDQYNIANEQLCNIKANASNEEKERISRHITHTRTEMERFDQKLRNIRKKHIRKNVLDDEEFKQSLSYNETKQWDKFCSTISQLELQKNHVETDIMENQQEKLDLKRSLDESIGVLSSLNQPIVDVGSCTIDNTSLESVDWTDSD